MLIKNFLIFLVLSISLAAHANLPQDACGVFDRVALQLALAQNGMQSPLSVVQLKDSLGVENKKTAFAKNSYSWVHKNLALVVRTSGDDIVDRIITGTGDGSVTARQMENVYTGLASATSVWDVEKIQQQLGAGYVVIEKMTKHNWICGIVSITITSDHSNDVVASLVNYRATHGVIEKRLGDNHPAWDKMTDSLGEFSRSWERNYSKG